MDGDAADFDFGSAEVDLSAQGFTGRQIVSAVRDMHNAQCTDDLEFNDDLILGHQVGGAFANDRVGVKRSDYRTTPSPEFRFSGASAFSCTLSTTLRRGALATLKAQSMFPPVRRLQPPSTSFIALHPANPP
jgi:hypothetical protein